MERKNEPVPERDYTVRVVDLDPQVRGVTAEDEDGHYSIYINARHSRLVQLRAFNHEVRHIRRGDFERWSKHKGE